MRNAFYAPKPCNFPDPEVEEFTSLEGLIDYVRHVLAEDGVCHVRLEPGDATTYPFYLINDRGILILCFYDRDVPMTLKGYGWIPYAEALIQASGYKNNWTVAVLTQFMNEIMGEGDTERVFDWAKHEAIYA